MKVVFPDQDIFAKYKAAQKYYEVFIRKAEVLAYPDTPVEEDERIRRLQDADVICFGVYKFDREILERLPNLKMLQFMGTGYANFVDMECCKEKSIIVKGTEDYGSNAVAEYAVAQAFTLARNIAAADRTMRTGKWTYDNLEGMEIAGSTVGIVGTGNIGRLVSKKFYALGANILANDVFESEELKVKYKIPYVTLEELFKTSDIISIHVKYIPQTAGLVTKELIDMMKPEALFINCSRAEIVDYKALIEALTKKRIKGAALDVFYEEPLLDFSISQLPNVITSPHIGFFTGIAKVNCLKMCLDSIEKEMKLE